jgi:type I restriction enzyme S subunit
VNAKSLKLSHGSSLPEGWTEVRIASICDIIRGVSYKKEQAAEEAGPGRVPILRATNIQAHKLILDDELVYVPAELVSDTQKLRVGDIVVATSSGSKHLVGKTAPVREYWNGSFGAFCAVLRPMGGIDSRYLAYFFESPAYRNYISKKTLGVNINNLRRTDLEEICVPIAPPKQQTTIVAEIEKQFSRLDETVANLKRVKANLKRYKAAVLKAAVEGKLTEEWRKAHPDVEPASELLNRILAIRRNSWRGKGRYKEPAAPDTTNRPEVPDGWALASLDQLSCHITSGSRDWSRYYGRGRGTFILAQNVRPLHFDLTARQPVDAPDGDPETERTRVAINDLLVTIVGANTGDICRVGRQVPDHYVCQSVALVRPTVTSCSRFLELYLASPENGQAQWQRYIYGQGRPHLSFEQLRMTAVLLPPIAEQQRILAEVELRLSMAQQVEAAVQVSEQRGVRVRQAILQHAFQRKLRVPDSRL